MGHGGGRHGEVDDHVGRTDGGRGVGLDLHVFGAHARDLAGIAAERVAGSALDGAGQGAAFGVLNLPDQHLAHAPGGAGNGDLHVVPLQSIAVD